MCVVFVLKSTYELGSIDHFKVLSKPSFLVFSYFQQFCLCRSHTLGDMQKAYGCFWVKQIACGRTLKP